MKQINVISLRWDKLTHYVDKIYDEKSPKQSFKAIYIYKIIGKTVKEKKV